MKSILNMVTGRIGATVMLLLLSVLSIALACSGSAGAIDFMRYYAAIGFVAGLAGILVVASFRSFKRLPVLLLHAGLALVLGGWVYNQFAGEADGYLRLRGGQTGRVESRHGGEGFNLTVRDFSIERWPDTGTIKQYICKAELESDGSPREEVIVSVNHPLVKNGWWVYQSSYEELENPHTGKMLYFTILQCVRDVGLPYAALGGAMILIGALGYAFCMRKCGNPTEKKASSKFAWALYALAGAGAFAMLVHRAWSTGHAPMQNMYEFLLCSAAMLPLLTFFARNERRALIVDAALFAIIMFPVLFVMDGKVKHLMPALQSPFFIPHVGSYVIGYILLVRAALGVGRNLTGLGFFLLSTGLVLGAAWGKVCWGHWWQWDPKEMWSLATWFVYAAYFHRRGKLSRRAENFFLTAGAVLIILTLTWINLSKIFTGMHSYA